jgi:hypothetical protein
MDANSYPGPAVINVYATCQPEHGVADSMSSQQEKMAVEGRAFPLFVYDPRKGEKIRERLSLVGNPAQKEDWWTTLCEAIRQEWQSLGGIVGGPTRPVAELAHASRIGRLAVVLARRGITNYRFQMALILSFEICYWRSRQGSLALPGFSIDTVL